jgi:hypothetical protein
MKSISEVMDEMKGARRNSPQLVRDWREMIPDGSRWHPGDPGDPKCTTCEGTGYLRIEGLPVTHSYFGKLVLCDCVTFRMPPQLEQRDDLLLPAGWPTKGN